MRREVSRLRSAAPCCSPDARPPESLAAAARPASTGRQLTIALPARDARGWLVLCHGSVHTTAGLRPLSHDVARGSRPVRGTQSRQRMRRIRRWRPRRSSGRARRTSRAAAIGVDGQRAPATWSPAGASGETVGVTGRVRKQPRPRARYGSQSLSVCERSSRPADRCVAPEQPRRTLRLTVALMTHRPGRPVARAAGERA